MPSTVRHSILSAGAALALGSLALAGAQLARPEEPRFVPEAMAAPRLEPVERKIEMLRRRLLLDTQPRPPEWERVAEVLRANARWLDASLSQRDRRRDRGVAEDAVRERAELARARARARQELLPALQSLYEVMQPHQRRAADRLFRGAVRPAAEGTPG